MTSIFQIPIIFSSLLSIAQCEIDIFQNIALNDHYPPKEMPKTEKMLSLVKEDCGEVCDTSSKFSKKPGKYFDIISKDFECDILLTSPILNSPLIEEEQLYRLNKPSSLYDVPKQILEMYTYDKRVPFFVKYFNQAYWNGNLEYSNWDPESVDLMIQLVEKRILQGGYGNKFSNQMKDLLEEHMIDNIKGKHVLVIGSTFPWIESILLHLGASNITTLEYAKVPNTDPRLNPVTPESLRKSILSGNVPEFDSMVTFSSVEHSGLGRYGDGLNPWGDLITMAQAWCLLKPGARALFGAPGGFDSIAFNGGRSYGQIMTPHIFANWNQIFSTYEDFTESEPGSGIFTEQNAEKFCGKKDDCLLYCYQPITILEKPSLLS